MDKDIFKNIFESDQVRYEKGLRGKFGAYGNFHSYKNSHIKKSNALKLLGNYFLINNLKKYFLLIFLK